MVLQRPHPALRLTPEQVELVQQSWRQVSPIAEQAAELFYSRLFTLDPSLRSLFRVDMKEQGRKLMSMIDLAVNGLTRFDALLPVLRELGQRHGGYGVRDEHYDTVASALIWTLEGGLGPSFTPQVRAAWITTYAVFAETMRAAASGEERARPAR
jgi:hemoglobin-like flavoprotein